MPPGPAGNDALIGNGSTDILLGAEGDDFQVGGAGNDALLGFAGSDFLVGQGGTDHLNAGEGDDQSFSRDGVAEAVTCGPGTDSALVDSIDTQPAADCETFTPGAAALQQELDRRLEALRRATGGR